MGLGAERVSSGEKREQLAVQVEELMQTEAWGTLEYLNMPCKAVEFEYVERDLPEPSEAEKIRKETWQTKLQEKQALLQEVNPENIYEIRHDDETANMALFENNEAGSKRKMWAGNTITLAQQPFVRTADQISVPVYQISYSEWIACYNPSYGEAYVKKDLPLPYAGIGVSVLMETTDGFLPLTRRGIETPVYPGRLYSPGGGPKPGETSTEAIMQEILEETGLKKGEHFDPSQLTALAMVTDRNLDGTPHARPELVAHLPLKVSYREVEQIQHETSVKKGKRQEDVWGVVPITTFAPNLERAIIYGGFEMCPPTEAGLNHLLLQERAAEVSGTTVCPPTNAALTHLLMQIKAREVGMEGAIRQMEGTIERVKSFGRTVYKPPIHRLKNL